VQVGADLSTLVAQARKPLRCLWLSQESRIWVDTVPDVHSMPFTPVILVSASLPNARQRRCLDPGEQQ
jgi:tRNA A64-2'-O-ribosylphosphate transferase